MPVRKIPPNGRSVTGRMACYGTSKSVGYESYLEHDSMLLFLFDHEVAGIEEQPVRIEYEGQDAKGRSKTRHYTPDLLVTFQPSLKRRPLLIEVKYHRHLREKRDELIPKIRAGHRYAQMRGWRFRVYTERHIRGTRLLNVRFLRPYQRFPRDHEAAARLLRALREAGRATPEKLLASLSFATAHERGRHIAATWWLLAAREIGVDLDSAPVSMSSPLWLPENPRG